MAAPRPHKVPVPLWRLVRSYYPTSQGGLAKAIAAEGGMWLTSRLHVYMYTLFSMSPSLHLMVHAPGLHMDARLRPEALSEVIALIQRFRVEETIHRSPAPLAAGLGAGFRPASPDMLRRRMPEGCVPTVLDSEGEAALARFRNLPWESLIALLPGKKFATKLLMLTAWLEAHGGQPVFKGEVRTHFARTGEPFPANPGRDTRTLIIDGLIDKTSDRQHLSLSEAGWKEAVRWLDADGGNAGAVAVAR